MEMKRVNEVWKIYINELVEKHIKEAKKNLVATEKHTSCLALATSFGGNSSVPISRTNNLGFVGTWVT